MSKIALKGNASGTGTFQIEAPNSNTDRTLTLQDASGDVVVAEGGTFKIDSSGNVGIGTASPSEELHLVGDMIITPRDQGIKFNNEFVSVFRDVDSLKLSAYSGITFFDTNASTERMRLSNSGTGGSVFYVGKTAEDGTQTGFLAAQGNDAYAFITNGTSAGGAYCLGLNRQVSDGVLINFRQGNTTEGTISVSGSTISYNGGHLSRWSRLADNTKDTSIVKGTVMTNLDAMVEWSHDEVLWTADDELPDGVSVGDVRTAAYIEDNEQLNKMAVSSVEGDANVAGVFVNWDDDDFNDMNIAMTGDMVIRIAQGTTVARGDLLMSAGDGTAKPQGDDIVRSKTIAKVTSTHVSHTYDDGSYLVPCVLMAC